MQTSVTIVLNSSLPWFHTFSRIEVFATSVEEKMNHKTKKKEQDTRLVLRLDVSFCVCTNILTLVTLSKCQGNLTLKLLNFDTLIKLFTPNVCMQVGVA